MSFEIVGIRLEADNAAAYFGDMAKGSKATDTFSAATAAAAAQVNVFDDSMRKAKIETLTDKLDSQQKKLKILEQELSETSKKYGEGSVQAQKKALAVDDLTKAITHTEGAIERENATLGREKAAFDAAAHAASASMPEVEKLGKTTKQAGDDAEQSGPKWKSLAEIATGALRRIGEMAVNAFAEAGQAAIGFFKDSISVAGDFESGMNKFAAVAGGALDDAGLSLKDFRDQFIQIGKELPVSTQEVQQAAIEMVKGGIEPATIAAGGLRQVIQFAAAADLDLEEASTIAAKALGGWTDMAASAQEKADFLAHSTDLLSKAANASTVNVDDLALGLYNVQGTAKLAGVSFDETVTALAELAPSFASSADAGTSFKVFLSRLQPTTKPAIAAMKGLGLYTDEAGSAFYDAQGQFIGMEKVSGLLQKATEGLTEAQRSQILQTIFGQDAIRVAAVLSEQGAKGYNNMTDALAKQNSVSDMAKQKQQGFNTALDNFKGSVEALQITIGSALLPILTELFNKYLAPGINILTDLAGALFGDADAFGRLSPAMQGVALAAETIWTSVSTLIDFIEKNAMPIINTLAGVALYTLVPAFVAWATGATTAGAATIAAMLPVIAPIAAIGVAIFVLTKAWQEDWGGIATAITDFWESVGKPIFDELVGWLSVEIPQAIKIVANFWNTTLLPALTAVWNFISTKIIPIIQSLIGTHFAALNASVSGVAILWNTVLWPALNKIWSFIDQNIIPLLMALANVFTAIVGVAVSGLTDKFNNELLPGVTIVSDFVTAHVLPDWNAVKSGFDIVASAISSTLGPALNWLVDNVLKDVSNWFDQVARGIQMAVHWLNELADAIRSLPSMPDAMVGHSPPPLAKWMNAIGDQSAYAANAMNAVGSSIRGVPASPMAIMAAGATSNTYNQQRSVALNYHTTYAPPASTSLAIASALAG